MTRPDQLAPSVPSRTLPRMRQMSARKSCPPSSGRPGSRLYKPTTALLHATPAARRTPTPPDGNQPCTTAAAAAMARLVSGPTTAIAAAVPRLFRFTGQRRMTRKEAERNPLDRDRQAACDQTMGRLVHQDRQPQEDAERRGNGIPAGADTGHGPRDRGRELRGDEGQEEQPVGRDVDRHAERAAQAKLPTAGRRRAGVRWLRDDWLIFRRGHPLMVGA